jgi:flagellar motility protein MotE (MotC chaperone)
MTDETKNGATTNGAEEQAPAPDSAESRLGGLKKYGLFGGIGVAVIAIAVALVFMFAGGEETAQEEGADPGHETAVAEKAATADEPEEHQEPGDRESGETGHETSGEGVEDELSAEEVDNLDFLIDESDQSVIDQITASLEFLDYDPDSDVLSDLEAEEGSGMSVEDSMEAVNWLVQEKAALSEREASLEKREKDLERLDQEVQRKILIVEQAESNRISKLAKLYDGMDPRSVTRLMANLDDATVVSVISRMKQKNPTQVLALLSPKRAARLSKMMITIAEN